MLQQKAILHHHKIALTNPKTTSKNSQTYYKSTVFSESNHFLIIMHSFSYPFLSNPAISNFKIIPFSISWKPSFPSKFHIFSLSYHFPNSKIYRNFLPWHTFSIRFTHKKRIYKIATNHPTHLIPNSNFPAITPNHTRARKGENTKCD